MATSSSVSSRPWGRRHGKSGVRSVHDGQPRSALLHVMTAANPNCGWLRGCMFCWNRHADNSGPPPRMSDWSRPGACLVGCGSRSLHGLDSPRIASCGFRAAAVRLDPLQRKHVSRSLRSNLGQMAASTVVVQMKIKSAWPFSARPRAPKKVFSSPSRRRDVDRVPEQRLATQTRLDAT